MEDKDYETYEGSLYDFTAGAYCGVLVKNETMRKLAKLQVQHLDSVKRLLTDEAEKGNVFPSMWALHYPKGQQTKVTFIDQSTDVIESIKRASTMFKPKHEPLVFIASSMSEAVQMADSRFNELEG